MKIWLDRDFMMIAEMAMGPHHLSPSDSVTFVMRSGLGKPTRCHQTHIGGSQESPKASF